MGKTSIAWTDRSANPIRARHRVTGAVGWHCVKISPGCAHCYAAAMNGWRGTGQPYTTRSTDEIELFFDTKPLEEISRLRNKRQRIFVCDMTDLFLDAIQDEWIDRIFAHVAFNWQHTYQVLTKRPERALVYFERLNGRNGLCANLGDSSVCVWPLPNLHLGVSVEDQATANTRIPILLQIPAAVRFVSAEPLLSHVDLGLAITGLDWVIVGGESGRGARPCDLAWIRSIRDQCRAAGVPAFLKQLGSAPFDVAEADRLLDLGVRDPKGGDPAEWPADLRVREFPSAPKEAALA